MEHEKMVHIEIWIWQWRSLSFSCGSTEDTLWIYICILRTRWIHFFVFLKKDNNVSTISSAEGHKLVGQ